MGRAEFEIEDFRHRVSDLNDPIWFDYTHTGLLKLSVNTLLRPQEDLLTHAAHSCFTSCSVKPFERFEPLETLTIVVNYECPEFACPFDMIALALFPTLGARDGPFNSTPVFTDYKFAESSDGGFWAEREAKPSQVCRDERGCSRWRMTTLFTIETLPIDEGVYVLKLKLADPFRKHMVHDGAKFESDEMSVPLIITKALHRVRRSFLTPHEQQEATFRVLGTFSLLGPSYHGDGATIFNPFVPKLAMWCDVFRATLTKNLDDDVRRRLKELVATGVKQHVIFAVTVGRSGTTHLANLISSSSQVTSMRRRASSCATIGVLTYVCTGCCYT